MQKINLTKIQHPLLVKKKKALSKVGIEKNLLHLIKGIYKIYR